MTVINNYQTWLALLQRVNVQQNGQIPPSVFNTWYNEVNKAVFKEYAEQYQLNQVMSDLLSPFVKVAYLPVTIQVGMNWGLVTYPADYQYFVGASILTQKQEELCFSNNTLPIIDGTGKSKKYTDPDYAQMAINYAGANIEEGQVQLIDNQRWPSCLTHYTKGATLKDPKATQYMAGFKVAPKGVVSVVLNYLTTPVDSIFAYDISDQDIPIYLPNSSTQLQWSDQVMPIFIAHLVMKYGAYINDMNIVKMGEEMLALTKQK